VRFCWASKEIAKVARFLSFIKFKRPIFIQSLPKRKILNRTRDKPPSPLPNPKSVSDYPFELAHTMG
jgi:hypothetical protein